MSDDEQTFSEHRKLLFAIAYRLLGSAADAEDVVQDAWFKWSGADREQVSDPKAYLGDPQAGLVFVITIAGGILGALGAGYRARRERELGGASAST